MMSTILRSTEFWESRGRKLRRPAENLVATVRTLGVGVSNWGSALKSLHWATAGLGHSPMDWQAPDGYPDKAAAWASAGTLLGVWQAHAAAVNGSYPGLAAPNIASMYAGLPATSGDAIARLALRLTGSVWAPTHLATLQAFVGEPASTPLAKSALTWMGESLVALILDGPHHALR
jgi:uncharacterized protein (DUF1800 family)